MSKKNKASSGWEESAGKKRSSDAVLSGRNIKTEELFNANFEAKGFRVEEAPRLVMSEWNNPAGHAKIRAWLLTLGSHFASILDKVERNSEAALYPLLVNALIPIMELSACLIETLNKCSKG